MNSSNNTAAKQVKDITEEIKNRDASESHNAINQVKRTGETSADYKEKVSDNITGAAQKIYEEKSAAQFFLSDKADLINEYTHKTIEKANEIGHRATDALAASTNYVKNIDFAETKQQIKAAIKDKPELSIVIAGVTGLLIGLLIGRKKKT